ncbi:hypothetical protein pb186bvf_013907 [Paramecium bursaria]
MFQRLKGSIPKLLQFVQNSNNKLTTYTECLAERIDTEQKYARSLNRIAEKLLNVDQNLSQTFAIKAKLSMDLSEQVREELQLLKSKQQKSKIQDRLKLWMQEMDDLLGEIKLTENNLKIKRREYENEGVLYLVNQLYQLDQKNNVRSTQTFSNLQSLNSQYKQLCQEFIKLNNSFEFQESLTLLEEQEIQKIQLLKDTQLKIFVYENSAEKSYLYDIEKISERIHQLDPVGIIQDFVEKNKKDISFEPILNNSFVSQFLEHQGKQRKQLQQDNFYEQNKEQQLSLVQQQILESQEKCEGFVDYLSKIVQQGQSQVDLEQFIFITNISLSFLDRLFLTREGYLMPDYINYSFVIFTKEQQTRYLQDMLTNHKIWQCRDLWETLIIESISQIKVIQKEQLFQARQHKPHSI